jgi:sulfofructose kinase
MTTHIICCGISVLDRVWPLPDLPTCGGKYHSDYLELGGGMAANAAVAAASLGAQTAYWGRGGDDSAGQVMQQEMAAYGVDVRHFRLCADVRSSVSAILVANDGERMIVNFRDADMPKDAGWLPLDDVHACHAVLADIR